VIIAVVASFLNEEKLLPTFLASIDAQERLPDRILLVDDGSGDRSPELAAHWAAERPWSTALRRPPRAPEADRLATAGELRSFQWAVDRIEEDWDVLVKLDTDLELTPGLFGAIERGLEADPRLGVAGSYLCARRSDGSLVREFNPPEHVRGPNKFYRRACYEQIAPLPPILGWDTIDEVRARMHGWRTASFAIQSGDILHLRPTGSHDGALRGYRRWGECAYAYGSHPLVIAGGAVVRMGRRPYVLCGLNYLAGAVMAAARSVPRAEPEARRFLRREQVRRLRPRLMRAASSA
jgi:biofilm PGA synthesis N-glycosyltransferase PgaC